MGQVDHQIVFPLLRLPGGVSVPDGPVVGQIQVLLHTDQLRRKLNWLTIQIGQLLCSLHHLIQKGQGLADKTDAAPQPGDSQTQQKKQGRIVPAPVEKVSQNDAAPPKAKEIKKDCA